MHQCCVFGCSNIAYHSFPRDIKTRELWQAATRCRIKKHSKICVDHFKPEDFCITGKYSGLLNTKRILKKGVVPSLFAWSKTENLKSKKRRECAEFRDANRKLTFSHLTDCEQETSTSLNTICDSSKSTAATIKLDDSIEYVEEVVTEEKCVVLPNLQSPQLTESIISNPSFHECGTQKNYQLYSAEYFRNDNKDSKKNDLKKNGVSTQGVAKEQENDFTEKNQSLRDRSVRLKNRKAYLANLRCSVPQCNARPTNEISLHPCPNNAAVRNEWAEALRVSYHYVKNMVACSLHFTKIDFIQSKNAERVLKYNAVPSRNLPNRKKVVVQDKNKSLKKVVPSKAFERQNTMTDVDETKEAIQEEVTRECRACLKKLDDKKSCCNVFQAWAPPWDGMEATIAEDLAKIANVEISITDRHSKVLCAPCYQRLLDAATFASRVRSCDLLLRMRFTAEIDMEKVWPKPIQVDKNINGSVYPMDVEIKQEVVSDEEYPVNAIENPYVETELANLDIKIEPEEFVEPPPMNITINGTISLDPLNSENKDLTNGTELHQETEYLEMAVKQEPTSDGEQEIEQAPDLPLECLLCTKSFNSVTGLKAHVIAQHSYKSVKRKLDGSVSPEKKRCDRHQCAICKRSFQTSTDLMVHETCHNKHACYGCTEKFDSFELLTRHRKRCSASIANSVQKLKTLEDVKRPLPEEKVEYIKKEIVKKEVETTNKDVDIEMKGLNSDQKEENSKENQTERVNEDVEIDKKKLEYENEEVENVKKLESVIKEVKTEKKAESEIEHIESYNIKVKSEVEDVENEENKIESQNKEISEPNSNMKLHLEIHSTKSETESTLSDADTSVETLKNEDCT